jgi:DNA-binding transcriptional LysR family regulator
MDHLAGMAVFAKVVEARSFTAAAEQLGLSKSAVSKQISRLEDRLGIRLLNRTTRRLSLTEAGAAYYERCARIVAEAEEADLAITHLQAEPRGVLLINAPMSFGIAHVAPAIPDFLARYPELRVDMSLNDRIVDLIDEGFDLAIRIGALADSSLIARRLAESRMVAVAAPDYLKRHGMPKRPEDLKRHNCLSYSYMPQERQWRFETEAGLRPVAVKGSFRANNGDAVRAAAVAGLGIAVLPSFIVGPDIRSGLLTPLLQDRMPLTTIVHAVYPHNRHLTVKVRAFVDFLADRFGPSPPWDDF